MKRAHTIEVRPTLPADGEFLAPCAWLAIDSTGRKFGADSELQARTMADEYNHPTHASRERGRVSHPARAAS